MPTSVPQSRLCRRNQFIDDRDLLADETDVKTQTGIDVDKLQEVRDGNFSR